MKLFARVFVLALVGSVGLILVSPVSAAVYTDHIENCKAAIASEMGAEVENISFDLSSIKSRSTSVRLRFRAEVTDAENAARRTFNCSARQSSGEVLELTEKEG